MNTNKPPTTGLTHPHIPPVSWPPAKVFYSTRRRKSITTLGELLAADPGQMAKLVAEAGSNGSVIVLKPKWPTADGYKRKKAKTQVGRHVVERTDSRGLPIILIETVYGDGSSDVAKYKAGDDGQKVEK